MTVVEGIYGVIGILGRLFFYLSHREGKTWCPNDLSWLNRGSRLRNGRTSDFGPIMTCQKTFLIRMLGEPFLRVHCIS